MENSKSKTIFPKVVTVASITRCGRLREGSNNKRFGLGKLGVLDIKKWSLMGGGRTWRFDCIHFGKCHSQQESKHPAKIITVVV